MKRDQSTLEREFARLAERRSRALAENDSKAANRYYDRLYRLKDEIRALPDKGEALLGRVISSSSDPEVRITAASLLLPINEAAALGELGAIAGGDLGLVSLTARMTVRQWMAGALSDYLR